MMDGVRPGGIDEIATDDAIDIVVVDEDACATGSVDLTGGDDKVGCLVGPYAVGLGIAEALRADTLHVDADKTGCIAGDLQHA